MKLKKNTKVTFAELPGTDLHKYFLTKKKGVKPVEIIGVTGMMSRLGLKEGYSGIKHDVLARASARGTAIHELFQAYEMEGAVVASIEYTWTKENGEQVTEREDVAKLLEKYGQLSASSLQAIAVEYLVSDDECVASLIDLVSEVDEHTVDLIDYKSTSRLDKNGLSWQLSIYKYLFEKQNKGIEVRHLYGVHCHDEKGLKLVAVEYKGDSAVADAIFRYKNGIEAQAETQEQTLPTIAQLFPEHTTLVSTLESKLQLENALEIINSQLAPIMDALKDKMRRDHLTEVLVPGGRYVFTEEHPYKRFDSKKFQKDHPDVYDKYVATSNVSASIKFYKAK